MTDIKGTTRVLGLIGNPVEHSFSPAIHNMLARECGMDTTYVTFKVESGRVESAIIGAYDLNILGMNVTVPHKQNCMKALKEIDDIAQAIGAVNTLVRVDGGFKGYNTDILGLYRELLQESIEIKEKEIVILGAGGAARAIAFLCVEKGASKVYILNRTIEKAENIACAVNKYFDCKTVKAMKLHDYDKVEHDGYIVIQASSVGLHPNDNEAIIYDALFYERALVGVDIIYNPDKTLFMKLMEKHGHRAYNGLKMLVFQAVSAYELWNNIKISDELCNKVYEYVKGLL